MPIQARSPASASSSAGFYPIAYQVELHRPEAHLLRVQCEIAQPDPAGQALRLPAWIPGSYLIREFARHIVSFSADSAGQPLRWHKTDKNTWQVQPCAGPLRVTIEVYCNDMSVRGAHVDSSHAFFNGTSVFLAVVGQEDQPVSVHLPAPAQMASASWRVATALRRHDASGPHEPGQAVSGHDTSRQQTAPWAFGHYHADNYADLIEHPVEMGLFELHEFDVQGVPHALVISGRHYGDSTRLVHDLQRICDTEIRFFGAPAPFDRYLFLLTVLDDAYGGLEHTHSTALLACRDDMPARSSGNNALSDRYRTLLGLCAHEYFHSWLVKRIQPESFRPYDLSQENYTSLLWLFEGFTSYYDDLILRRSGLISTESYLELLAQTITRVWRTPGRFRQSVAESSVDAWTRFYRPDENTPNSVISYYTKGALVALSLDLQLRQESAGLRSLDDVMQLLWQRFGKAGTGLDEAAVIAIINEVAASDQTYRFQQYIWGREDLPLLDLLPQQGVALHFRAQEGASDNGGKPGRNEGVASLSLGIKAQAHAVGVQCAQVFENGAAQQAGISAGDVMIAIDGWRITVANLDTVLGRYAVGDRIMLHIFRRDELQQHVVCLQPAALDTAYIVIDDTEKLHAGGWLNEM